MKEIGDHSISGFRFPRRTFQDGVGSCVSSRGEIFGSSSVYSNLSGQDLSHCSSIFTTARSSQQLSSRCSTARTSTHSPSTVLSSRALDPVYSGLGSLYSYPGSSLYSSVLVAAEGKCHDRVSPGISSSQSDPIHRRFPSGMGSLSGGSNCFRDMVFHPSERSHQSNDAKWTIFSDWCVGREIDPFKISVQQLADFLVFLFEVKGLAPSTVKGYISAISRTIHISGGDDFGNNQCISLLVCNFSLERPRQRVLVPQWNIGLVLLALNLTPFEPAEEVDLKFLSYKCCFLLALASGRRRSEVHAFSTSNSCLRFDNCFTCFVQVLL